MSALKAQSDASFDSFVRIVLLGDLHESDKPKYIKYTDETWNQR